MEISEIILLCIFSALVVNLVWACLLKSVNSSLSFGSYFFISLFFTPILAVLLAIVEVVSNGQKKNEKMVPKETPKKLSGKKIWIANEKDKRIEIYESELDDYLKDGWHKIKQ